jgi:ankyrin repeat protein/mono/diheme cytochrome c family protein
MFRAQKTGLRFIGLLALGLLMLGLAGSAVATVPAVIEAVKQGNREALRTLIKAHADVNAPEADGTTALHWAVRAGDLATVNLLLGSHANAMAANRYGVKPLSVAAVNGNGAMMEALLKAGANPDTANPEGETALMTASRSGSLAAVKALLAHGANVNAKEKWLQETALMWAAAENHPDVVEALIATGANIDEKSWVTDTPVLDFPESGGPNMPFPRGGWTAAMYAARQNATAALRVLAGKRANLNLQDPQGATALQLAIINLHYDAAALLLEKGADPNIADETGMTALYAVANMDTLGWIQGRPAPPLESNGEVDAAALVNKLLDRGANPNARLQRAILKRHHDFQPERVLTEGATPLMRAARYGDAKLARILLARGADPTLTTKDGSNALLFAAGVNLAAVRGEDPSLLHPSEDGSIEIIKMLLDRGMDINVANEQGLTALHGAVQRGQGVGNGSGEKIIELLAERGAELDVKDKKGRTPLELARAGQGQILNRVEDSGPAARLLARLSGDTVAATPSPLAAKTAEPAKTVELVRSQRNTNLWNGVYTAAQAGRGQAAYKLYCQACHGENLAGGKDAVGRAPALRGENLLSRKDLNNLFSYIRTWMPEDDRGSLDDHTVVDIVTHILKQNAFPAGPEELVADSESLKQIQIVKKPE